MLCDKVSYELYKDALGAARAISIRDNQSMRVYKCEGCGEFHLATNGKHKLRKIKDNKYPIKVEDMKPAKPQKLKPVRNKAPKDTSRELSTDKFLTEEQTIKLKNLFNET